MSEGFNVTYTCECSIAINSTVRDGHQVYRCNAKGGWEPSYRSATLRDPKNESIVLGTYVNYYVRNRGRINAGTWTLANSDADRSESGRVSSIVAGEITIPNVYTPCASSCVFMHIEHTFLQGFFQLAFPIACHLIVCTFIGFTCI